MHIDVTFCMKQKVIDNVRIQQTKHLVLDIQKAQDNSAQLEEEKILATAQRLQQKEMMCEVGIPRQLIHTNAPHTYQCTS